MNSAMPPFSTSTMPPFCTTSPEASCALPTTKTWPELIVSPISFSRWRAQFIAIKSMSDPDRQMPAARELSCGDRTAHCPLLAGPAAEEAGALPLLEPLALNALAYAQA